MPPHWIDVVPWVTSKSSVLKSSMPCCCTGRGESCESAPTCISVFSWPLSYADASCS